MKSLLKKFYKWIKKTYAKMVTSTRKLIPIAINIVEAIKDVQDSVVDDVILAIVKMAIPGDADDKLIAKVEEVVRKWLPKILLDLKMVESIANITDPNEQLKAILAQLKLSSNEAQNIIYHGLCALIMEKLSDGKISWSEAVQISEYYYINVMQK